MDSGTVMVKNPLHPPSTDSSSELNNNNTTSSTSFDIVVSSVYTPCYDTASSIFAPGGPSSNLILGGASCRQRRGNVVR